MILLCAGELLECFQGPTKAVFLVWGHNLCLLLIRICFQRSVLLTMTQTALMLLIFGHDVKMYSCSCILLLLRQVLVMIFTWKHHDHAILLKGKHSQFSVVHVSWLEGRMCPNTVFSYRNTAQLTVSSCHRQTLFA